jgi:opacity protein-like surface antigen
MNPFQKWLAVAVLSSLAPVSYANSYDYGEDAFGSEKPKIPDLSGFYGGIGTSTYQTDCFLSTDQCQSGGWKLYGGYDITEKVSLEMTYHNLGTIEDLDVTGTGMAGVVTLPIGKNGFSVLGKVGAVKLNAQGTVTTTVGTTKAKSDVKKSATGMLIGAGTEYDIDDNWKIRTEYEHIGGDQSVGLLSIGVGYSSL